MSRPGLVVVTLEGSGGDQLPFPVARRLAAADASSPAELAQAASIDSAPVLWLPPWTRLDERAAAEVLGWMARAGLLAPGEHAARRDAGAEARPESRPRVARVRLRLTSPESTLLAAEPCIVLSSPGAVDLVGESPVARAGAVVEDLAAPWEAPLPASLAEHLESVNRQSSVTARLRFAAGLRPGWRDLAWTPARKLVRGLAGLEGSRRAGLPRLVVEGYREVLVSAKLWELAQGAGAA